MHDRFAIGTEAAQSAETGAGLNEVSHPPGRGFRGAALKAIEFPRFKRLLLGRLASLYEAPYRGTAHHDRSAVVGDREALFDPQPDRISVRPERPGGFLHRISEMNFDAPGIDSVIGHVLPTFTGPYSRGGIGVTLMASTGSHRPRRIVGLVSVQRPGFEEAACL